MTEGRITILGIPIDPLTMEEALNRCAAFIAGGAPHHVFTADASGIIQANDNPELGAIAKRADLITADGAGVMWAARHGGRALPERVSGCDLVQRLSERAATQGWSVFYFGSEPGVAEAAVTTLTKRSPGLRVAGVRNGYYAPAEEATIVKEIAAARPDILIVGLGIPRQEFFIRNNFAALGVPVMVGVGGSLDVISGRLKRAPRWMQRTGLEWLFRLAQQPSRLSRVLGTLPRFFFAVLRSRP